MAVLRGRLRLPGDRGQRVRLAGAGASVPRAPVAAVVSSLRAFLLAVVIFPVAEATHEVGHLAAYSFFGYPASLQVTPWQSALFGVRVFGVHAAPAVPPSVPVHVAVDFLGPAAAAVLLSLLWLAVPRGAVRTALLANLLVLVYFAIVETVFAVGENVAHAEMDALTIPELNYGVCLAIVVGTAALATRRPSRRQGASRQGLRPESSL